MMQTIYTKALSEGEWFGGWAPLPARLEWQQSDGRVALFRLAPNDLTPEDEYEYFRPDTLVLAVPEDGDWRVQTGVLAGSP